MHVDTPGQDTQNNWPVGASGFGLATFAQPDPDALAPAGTASTVAVRATDARTVKMIRSRTWRMGPPLRHPAARPQPRLLDRTPARRGWSMETSGPFRSGTRRARPATVPAWLVRRSPPFPDRRQIREPKKGVNTVFASVDQARSPVAVALPSPP